MSPLNTLEAHKIIEAIANVIPTEISEVGNQCLTEYKTTVLLKATGLWGGVLAKDNTQESNSSGFSSMVLAPMEFYLTKITLSPLYNTTSSSVISNILRLPYSTIKI